MATLRYADSAENDLLDAWLYVAADNPEAADRIVEAIDREARLLLAHPGMGRERPELAAGLRSWPTTTRYILFYFCDTTGLTIARILHHARDVAAAENWQ
jgi:plasmid stabilization system protein ParE